MTEKQLNEIVQRALHSTCNTHPEDFKAWHLCHDEDAQFYANARSDVIDLVNEIHRLKDKIVRMKIAA